MEQHVQAFLDICATCNQKAIIAHLSGLTDKDFTSISKRAVFVASSMGFVDVLQFLLHDKKFDVMTAINFDGRTPLHMACMGEPSEERKQVVELLLKETRDKKYNIDFLNQPMDENHETAFFKACNSGQTSLVELLLKDKRIDVNKSDSFGRTPFHNACINGNEELVEFLLNNESIEVNCEDNYGNTPLAAVCDKIARSRSPLQEILISIFKKLLANVRIDVNKVGKEENKKNSSKREETPFYKICATNNLELVKYMLDRENCPGLDVNQPDKDGRSPFYKACDNLVITGAAIICRQIFLLLLADERTDIQKPDNYGTTPFDMAYFSEKFGTQQVVHLLQEKLIHKVNHNGESFFFEACAKNREDRVKELLKINNPVMLNATNILGETPFYAACAKKQWNIVELLLENRNVDINCANNKGETPFYHACAINDLKLIILLLNDQRVNPDEANFEGKTPFYLACATGNMFLVKLLIKQRVSINKKNNKGETPFFVACSTGNVELVKLLLGDLRTNIYSKNRDGITPYKYILNECEKLSSDNYKAIRDLLKPYQQRDEEDVEERVVKKMRDSKEAGSSPLPQKGAPSNYPGGNFN